ncbi:RibD family protein [Acuticoccus sp. M5D2P5]|uniref:RibD family protein n=1 Tax=Acuticoccus kalidii TaxID=2910977 RepID=UPI001F325986|nr:RibD family protein [Acuticoccus kalidii]MCF3932075.1 RibD family protein [Acuticoccus kalidii]
MTAGNPLCEEVVAARLPSVAHLAAARVERRPLVVAQLGQSLDGRIATPTGHSHYINGPAAIAALHALRAHVDAVVVGAGTASSDDPQLTVRRCPGENPARVLIDRRRRCGAGLQMLAADGVRRIVFGTGLCDDPPGVEIVEAAPSGEALAPGAIIAALAERGMTRILVEGGAATVSGFLAAGVLDRLCILVGPIIVGSGPVGLDLPAIDTLDAAHRPTVETVALPGGDVVFDCGFQR